LHRSFLSLGSINADFQFEVSADLSRGGTLVVESYVQRAGGKGANRALFAQRVGSPAMLIGRVGKDHFAQQALDPLRDNAVDLSGVMATAAAPTGVSMIAVPENGEKTILLAANANREWDEGSLSRLRDIIARADEEAVLTLDFEVSEDAVRVALDAAADRQMRVIADGSFGRDVRAEHLPKLCAIAPNVHEAEAITGMEIRSDADGEAAARKISDRGVDVVCIKLLEGGCMLLADGTVEKIKPVSVEVADKTGAGDAFTAALGLAVLEGKSSRNAAIYGVAASTLSVTKKGSQEAYPTRRELDQMAERMAINGATT
jgi:ribokinase